MIIAKMKALWEHYVFGILTIPLIAFVAASSLTGCALDSQQLGILLRQEKQEKWAASETEKKLVDSVRSAEAYGDASPQFEESLMRLGAFYSAGQKYWQAESVYQKLLAIQEKKYGYNSKAVAASLEGLGIVYYGQGSLKDAEKLIRESLAIMERKNIASADAARCMASLASVYSAQGKTKSAEALLRKALFILETKLGAANADTLTVMDNLALEYANCGKIAQAESLYLRAINATEHIFGSQNIEVASRLHNLAQFYAENGRYEDAEPLLIRSQAILEKTVSGGDALLAHNMNSLAVIYDDLGNFRAAGPLYERALVIAESNWGKAHLEVADILLNMAEHYRLTKDLQKSESAALRCKQILTELNKIESGSGARCLYQLGDIYLRRRENAAAEQNFQLALMLSERFDGLQSRSVALSCFGLAKALANQGRYIEAGKQMERTVAIVSKITKPNDPERKVIANEYAIILHKLNRGDQSIKLLPH